MDPYFTFGQLMGLMFQTGLQTTGTISKFRLPKTANFKSDKCLKTEGRVSCDSLSEVKETFLWLNG